MENKPSISNAAENVTATGSSIKKVAVLFAGGPALTEYWIYAAGPVLGAIAAARVYEALRGGDEHAQGAPNDLFAALERAQHAAERAG